MIPATPATIAIRVTVRAITMTTSNENLYLPLFSTYIADIFWGEFLRRFQSYDNDISDNGDNKRDKNDNKNNKVTNFNSFQLRWL